MGPKLDRLTGRESDKFEVKEGKSLLMRLRVTIPLAIPFVFHSNPHSLNASLNIKTMEEVQRILLQAAWFPPAHGD